MNCSACGARLQQGCRFCISCGCPIIAFAIPPKKTSSFVIFLSFLGLSLLGLLLIGFVASRFVDSENPAPSAEKDECGGNSFAYLLALKNGDSIAVAFWKPGITPKTLFAVRDFDQINHGETLWAMVERLSDHRPGESLDAKAFAALENQYCVCTWMVENQ
jgi:hypothetical protein